MECPLKGRPEDESHPSPPPFKTSSQGDPCKMEFTLSMARAPLVTQRLHCSQLSRLMEGPLLVCDAWGGWCVLSKRGCGTRVITPPCCHHHCSAAVTINNVALIDVKRCTRYKYNTMPLLSHVLLHANFLSSSRLCQLLPHRSTTIV